MKLRLGPVDRVLQSEMSKFLAEAMWLLIAVVGGFALALGMYFDFDFLKTVGTSILSAGVFSAVATSRFFSKIFAKVVQDVVFGREFLAARGDLDGVWKMVTEILCERKFPELKDKIDSAVLDNYLPKSRDFYYSKVVRNYKVLSLSDDGRSIECKVSSELTIRPHSGLKKIVYENTFMPSEEGEKIGDEEIKIDGVPITDPNFKGSIREYSEGRGCVKTPISRIY